MSSSLLDAFPDEGDVLCTSFFTSPDVSEKNWANLGRLAETDDITFWTVISRHERIGALIANCTHVIDLAHSTASTSARRAVRREHELSLMLILMRIATTTDICIKRFVRSGDLARRVGEVLPLKVLLPASVTMLRRSGATASIVLTALCIMNPAYLSRFPVHLSEFYDHVERIASRCTAEMKRGRFQRLAGDMLPLIEQCYRVTKQLWAFVQAVPFVADYVPLPKVLRALRVVVDVVSPCLQHFIIVSDVLKNRRDVLSRANSMMINAALNAASVLILYRTFQTPRGRACCCPQVCQSTYEQLTSFVLQYTKGIPFIVVTNWKSTIQRLMHQLCPPDESEESSRVGIVLRQLMEPIENSRDFSELFAELRPRFFELLLIDLVRQRFHIDTLLVQQFLTSDEAARLGASEDIITRALAGLDMADDVATRAGGGVSPPTQAARQPSATPPPRAASAAPDDPHVTMVLDVFPFYNPLGVRAALNFYKNDVEQFSPGSEH
ncbi:hypothetical protein STCU_08703 [Strigomonas culicis]|uniref:Uncharacterized protein n=1 Tax=Strigomonas culicis TaxID=28005 RepID=S9VDE4_9TRYP|nr:hypothetical protein STCU_08703 [Strigomonas culicis]|eukprot:EPY21090.1 hypothetical protein STCU_08703 [Strigomonas culicis]